jgi:hypothetical protein
MRQILKIAFVAGVFASALGLGASDASARGRTFPLTRCGPDLAYLCPIHGSFDGAPFHYSLAIYPGCIQVQKVEMPAGIRRLPVLVCG